MPIDVEQLAKDYRFTNQIHQLMRELGLKSATVEYDVPMKLIIKTRRKSGVVNFDSKDAKDGAN